MKERKEFSKIIRELLIENCLSQSSLAEILEIHPNTVSKFVHGKMKPDYDVLKKIAQNFEVSGDYLLGLKEY